VDNYGGLFVSWSNLFIKAQDVVCKSYLLPEDNYGHLPSLVDTLGRWLTGTTQHRHTRGRVMTQASTWRSSALGAGGSGATKCDNRPW